MVGAVDCHGVTAAETRRLGSSRLVGTLSGATVGAALSQVVFVRPVTLAVGIAISMLLTQSIGLPAAARLAGYVSGVVLLAYHDHPWMYAAAAPAAPSANDLRRSGYPPRAIVIRTRTTPMAATAAPVRHGRQAA